MREILKNPQFQYLFLFLFCFLIPLEIDIRVGFVNRKQFYFIEKLNFKFQLKNSSAYYPARTPEFLLEVEELHKVCEMITRVYAPKIGKTF
jgi:hypothetical protein